MGKPAWVAGPGGLGGTLNEAAEAFAAEGKTVVAVAVDGVLSGLIAVADREKEGAKAAVEGLVSLGIEPVMLTGDAERAARAIASRVGIARVVAGVLPDGKEAVLRAEQEAGHVVAMVGDGINDAPALARADVGVAIGTGTDVAMEASDVTLVGGDPRGVVRAVGLSRATMRTIRENLFWAFFYNVLLVPVAAGALHGLTVLPGFLRDLHPALAAAAMALSSITVVGNSLRLARRRIE